MKTGLVRCRLLAMVKMSSMQARSGLAAPFRWLRSQADGDAAHKVAFVHLQVFSEVAVSAVIALREQLVVPRVDSHNEPIEQGADTRRQ